jgi:hypothetical protein
MDTRIKERNFVLVKKASGEEEPFEVTKLVRSLQNTGADNQAIKEIVNHMIDFIYPGITTKKIYTVAFQLLSQKKTSAAIYYKLKQAIMELGPSGYPFEKFIGKIFEKQGYHVQVAQVVDGCCVKHEIDVIASKENIQHLVECKYRTAQEKNISIQTPLYVRARIDDIVKKRKTFDEFQTFSFEGWLVTNTRFSSDSIEYAKCAGLHLLGWDYPRGNALKEIIEKEKLYPLTVLGQLLKKEKQQLLDQGLVLCSEIAENPEVLEPFGLSRAKQKNLINELKEICL